MELIFLSNNPFNSAVADSATGDVLYNVESPFSFGHRTTTIRDARGQQVARYKPRSFGSDEVEFGGGRMNVSDWLPRAGLFTSSRKFTAPNGREYLWERVWGRDKFILIDRETSQVVACSHPSSIGLFSKRRKIGLELSPEMVPFLDVILLSFIICEENSRRGNAGGGSGGAGA